ncbi:MAG: GNAT family N-acetyltransferase [Anaerolineae bacterium]|nr:GNAT family N-acetyltransferase [Anaerolineae bacterium]NUQ06000.1 GNAT family N-acetyltransferase [Anaerolineae bacterium]
MIRARQAEASDSAFIHTLSVRVQEALTHSGSLQQIGPIPPPIVADYIRQGYAVVAEAAGERVGSVFVEPLRADQAALWGIPQADHRFLSRLMIEPSRRGQGWGGDLVRAVQRQCAAQGRRIVLDCWVGSVKLRRLYAGLGFVLHGEFDEDDYQIAVYLWS